MIHELKISPTYFHEVDKGTKPFEIRKDDRGFKIGHSLLLREWVPMLHYSGYTGREMLVEVTYITHFQQQEGYVVMGIKKI